MHTSSSSPKSLFEKYTETANNLARYHSPIRLAQVVETSTVLGKRARVEETAELPNKVRLVDAPSVQPTAGMFPDMIVVPVIPVYAYGYPYPPYNPYASSSSSSSSSSTTTTTTSAQSRSTDASSSSDNVPSTSSASSTALTAYVSKFASVNMQNVEAKINELEKKARQIYSQNQLKGFNLKQGIAFINYLNKLKNFIKDDQLNAKHIQEVLKNTLKLKKTHIDPTNQNLSKGFSIISLHISIFIEIALKMESVDFKDQTLILAHSQKSMKINSITKALELLGIPASDVQDDPYYKSMTADVQVLLECHGGKKAAKKLQSLPTTANGTIFQTNPYDFEAFLDFLLRLTDKSMAKS